MAFHEEGMTPADIARRLYCSPNAVSHYLESPQNYNVKKVKGRPSYQLTTKNALNGRSQKAVVVARK